MIRKTLLFVAMVGLMLGMLTSPAQAYDPEDAALMYEPCDGGGSSCLYDRPDWNRIKPREYDNGVMGHTRTSTLAPAFKQAMRDAYRRQHREATGVELDDRTVEDWLNTFERNFSCHFATRYPLRRISCAMGEARDNVYEASRDVGRAAIYCGGRAAIGFGIGRLWDVRVGIATAGAGFTECAADKAWTELTDRFGFRMAGPRGRMAR